MTFEDRLRLLRVLFPEPVKVRGSTPPEVPLGMYLASIVTSLYGTLQEPRVFEETTITANRDGVGISYGFPSGRQDNVTICDPRWEDLFPGAGPQIYARLATVLLAHSKKDDQAEEMRERVKELMPSEVMGRILARAVMLGREVIDDDAGRRDGAAGEDEVRQPGSDREPLPDV